MSYSKELIDYVVNADVHTILSSVVHSTSLRDIVTIAHMIEHHENKKAECASTQTA